MFYCKLIRSKFICIYHIHFLPSTLFGLFVVTSSYVGLGGIYCKEAWERKRSTTTNQGSLAIWYIRPKRILNSNVVKSRSSVTSFAFIQSFWNSAQSTAVSLPCSVQNFKTIARLSNELWANELSRDLDLKGVSNGYLIYCIAPSARFLPTVYGRALTRSRVMKEDATHVINFDTISLFFFPSIYLSIHIKPAHLEVPCLAHKILNAYFMPCYQITVT